MSVLLAKNETGVWPAESKTPEVQEISPQSLPGNENSVFRNSVEYLCQIYKLKLNPSLCCLIYS